jgi:hypothetical protein
MSHDSLDAVIGGYMLAVEGGDVPNRQELLDRHPEHAHAPRACFVDLAIRTQSRGPSRDHERTKGRKHEKGKDTGLAPGRPRPGPISDFVFSSFRPFVMDVQGRGTGRVRLG